MLAEASLHLTGVLLLGPHLTEENCAELLARARFRTKREIERLLAEIAPCPDVPSRIVPLHRAGVAGAADWMVSPLDELPGLWAPPRNTWSAYVRGLAGEVRELQAGLGAGQAPPRGSDEPAAAATSGQTGNAAAYDRETGARTLAMDEQQEVSTPANDERRQVSAAVAPGASQPPTSAPPVAELRYKVQFTADQAYVDLLEEARNLLQHELRGRDLVAVQHRALELLVHKLRQRKYAARERPRRQAPEPALGTSPSQPKSTSARPIEPQSAMGARHPAPKSATRARHSAPQSATDDRLPVPRSLSAARLQYPAPWRQHALVPSR